jgi:hypothetical protein
VTPPHAETLVAPPHAQTLVTPPHAQVQQRMEIREETEGKLSEPSGAFAPKGFSITVALATRDNRDPNRCVLIFVCLSVSAHVMAPVRSVSFFLLCCMFLFQLSCLCLCLCMRIYVGPLEMWEMLSVCTCVCICACVYVCVSMLYTYTYTYIHIHIIHT